jgi:hypothetical protein
VIYNASAVKNLQHHKYPSDFENKKNSFTMKNALAHYNAGVVVVNSKVQDTILRLLNLQLKRRRCFSDDWLLRLLLRADADDAHVANLPHLPHRGAPEGGPTAGLRLFVGRRPLDRGQGIDFTKLHFGGKIFHIISHPQTWDKFPPQNSI